MAALGPATVGRMRGGTRSVIETLSKSRYRGILVSEGRCLGQCALIERVETLAKGREDISATCRRTLL